MLRVDAVAQLEGGEDGEYLSEEGDAEEHRHQGDQTSARIQSNPSKLPIMSPLPTDLDSRVEMRKP